MAKKNIVLLGAGGHARSCIDVIEQEGSYKIRGLIGLQSELGTQVGGYPVLGVDADLTSLIRKDDMLLVTIGQIKTAGPRVRLFDLLINMGCSFPTIVSPFAYVASRTSLGVGTIVMHGAIVNAGVFVGRNCIINSQSLIEHDVVIEDHCHISTAVVLNGGVTIGEKSFIGSCSCVRESINIGKECFIGMGQKVFVDCKDYTQVPLLKAKQ